MLYMIILSELVRLYMLGLIVFLTLSIMFGVSIPALIAASSMSSVLCLPFVIGLYTSVSIEAGRFISRKVRGVHSWICSRKA